MKLILVAITIATNSSTNHSGRARWDEETAQAFEYLFFLNREQTSDNPWEI